MDDAGADRVLAGHSKADSILRINIEQLTELTVVAHCILSQLFDLAHTFRDLAGTINDFSRFRRLDERLEFQNQSDFSDPTGIYVRL